MAEVILPIQHSTLVEFWIETGIVLNSVGSDEIIWIERSIPDKDLNESQRRFLAFAAPDSNISEDGVWFNFTNCEEAFIESLSRIVTADMFKNPSDELVKAFLDKAIELLMV